MPKAPDQDLTLLLARVRAGDAEARSELIGLTYAELRGLAGHVFQGQPRDHTLQPTALVSELCLRLLKTDAAGWEDRKHFFRAAACAMRNLLTDHARAKKAVRRGGDHLTVSLGSSDVADPGPPIDIVVLDEALTRLAALDKRIGEICELRFLVGLSVDKTAEILGISPRTVELDTQFIRAWLQKELSR